MHLDVPVPAPAAGGPAVTPEPLRQRWTAAAVACLGLYLLGLDMTILNVAAPSLQRGFDATTAQIQWVIDGYSLVLGGTVLATGAVTDRIGRRRAFMLGLALCAGAASVGATASGVSQLIGARFAMGAGSALLMPATLSLVTNLFPEPDLRRRAIALWSSIGAVGVATGPVIGGYVVEHSTWRAAFWINVPVAAVAVVLARRFVRESRAPRAEPVDVAGAALSAASLLSVVWAIIEAPARGWADPVVISAFGAGAVLLALFAVHQHRSRCPMLPLALLRRPEIGIAAAVLALLSCALIGSFFLVSLYLQTVLGYTPWQAGVRIVPIPVAMIAGAAVSVPLAVRFGARAGLMTGLVSAACGLAFLAATEPDSGYAHLAVFEVLSGFGVGLAAAVGTESVMSGVPATQAALGSAVNDATRQVGAALGIAIQGSVLAVVYRSRLSELLAGTPAEPLLGSRTADPLVAVTAAEGTPPRLRALFAQAAREAFLDGMVASTCIALGLTVLVAAVAVALPGRVRRPRSVPDLVDG